MVGSTFLQQAEFKSKHVRLGDGAPTQRDRIINDLEEYIGSSGEPVMVELVDEKHTSGAAHHSDTEAALNIALTPGHRVAGTREVNPSDGELRELQRRSRIMSGGKVTISRELAELVALGRIDLAEAIRRMGSDI